MCPDRHGRGYAAALLTGLVPHVELAELANLSPVQLPRIDYFAWSFDAVMIAPFLIAALANTLKAAALLTTAERSGMPTGCAPT